MKKSSFQTSLSHFENNMALDTDILVRILTAKVIVKSVYDKRAIFEAFVLRLCSNWEILVEDLIIDCINKDTTRYAEYTGYKMSRHLPRDMCKAIMFGINYLDFKDIHHLKGVSKKVLVDECNPFMAIPREVGIRIDEFYKFRNYLAHYSSVAKRALEKVYKNKYRLKTFREPGSFLTAIEGGLELPRMFVYINAFYDASDEMGKYLGVESR